jgi:hypothetical protein
LEIPNLGRHTLDNCFKDLDLNQKSVLFCLMLCLE